ncbi:HAD family hydrolase [Faecalibacter rhinopitheci]|uniref:HAD family hydrolase n=1 Tax=Faecalibacter rhinopitheci TaxID=2779678 RepID=A0A8J7FVN4_9FLAO|nr:HAD family hydrolase [Faecalibacter rhinopitheci]MBF0597221.1 HAD family hydrolase [Faecalibacter rhinopitheci]MBQ0147243.1 HAD family hydrolase [Candidatus Onthonaster equi]
MNLKNIKLIVSDMDGTLLRSNHELSPEFNAIHQQLIANNIHFVPASGRQFYSITSYFENNKDEMSIIAENGTYVTYKGNEVFVDELDRDLIKDIILETRTIKGANLVLAGKNAAYVESKDEDFLAFFQNFYSKNIQVNDLLAIENEQFIKVAIHHADGSATNLYPKFKRFEQNNLNVVISGELWMDMMNKGTNKGKALTELQEKLGITKDETMVFGDYMNDIEMLKLAKYSYAMANAHPSVKEVANFEAPSNDDDGVLQVIKQLFN